MNSMTRRGKKEGLKKGVGGTLERWKEEDGVGGKVKPED